jgi:hypothetical protein
MKIKPGMYFILPLLLLLGFLGCNKNDGDMPGTMPVQNWVTSADGVNLFYKKGFDFADAKR